MDFLKIVNSKLFQFFWTSECRRRLQPQSHASANKSCKHNQRFGLTRFAP